jgi:hypothetical protein
MIAKGVLSGILALMVFCSAAHAQLVTALRLNQNQYVAGESVIATISITNHSGRELLFHSDGHTEWLALNVKNHRGNPVNPRARKTFGSLKIGPGQSMSRSIDLSQHFLLTEQGNYSVSALVRMPDGSVTSSATNRVLFNLNPGRLYWSQKVGIRGQAGQTREYRILQFSGSQHTKIYAQIIDTRTGIPISTFPLGDMLSIRKPSVTVDGNQRMHVFYLATPTMWVHQVINTDGTIVARNIHQRGAQGDPKLMTFGDGSVRVMNSIPYDAAAVAAARAKIRKISERPRVVYE